MCIRDREYTGCTVNFKTYTNSIWDKKRHLNPVENQAIFPDTHERIIDDAVFEKVQEIRSQRHRMTRTGKSSIFSGMVYCADCGSKMQYGSSNNRDFSQDFFDCSLHKKNGSKCKGHFIRVKVLEGRVLSHVQRVTDYILCHEDYFRKVMEEQLRVESTEKLTIRKKQLARDEKRIADLKRLFMKIYEDNVNGKLSDCLLYTSTAIFTEAFLSFVGLGIPVPQCSLGSLISELYNSCLLYTSTPNRLR